MPENRRGALFVVPSVSQVQGGPVPAWFNTAGWAAAARKILGESWIMTLDGTFTPEEARRLASQSTRASVGGRQGWRQRVPLPLRLAYKDLRQLVRARRFRTAALNGPWRQSELEFVWQRHDLFYTTGHVAAREFGRPLVLFVAAPRVWEDHRWGVRRPGWGWVVEAVGEDRQLRAADLVACVSKEVAEEVHRRGVSSRRLLVTPGAVDLELFSPNSEGEKVRNRLNLNGNRVVGWIGSFRSFHGLELAIRAVRAVQERFPDVALLLVGDGQERRTIESAVRDAGLDKVVFTGTVSHDDMAAYINAMDVALVLARHGQEFHYSPLKLREYLACGVPVVAPRVGELARTLRDGDDAVLVPPGDSEALSRAIVNLFNDEILARRLAAVGRRRMAESGSCEHQVRRVLDALSDLQGAASAGVGK